MSKATITHKNPARRGIELQNEGVTEERNVQVINIAGSGHQVVKTGEHEVTIYSPIDDYVSYFNTSDGNNDCTIYPISAISRFISAPTVEGTPFKIGDWIAGMEYPTTQLETFSFTTANPCLFDDTNSTIEVQIIDADGLSIITSKITGAISGNYTHTSNNIRIQVTGFEAELGKYKGIINVDVYTNLIIPQGGRLSIRIIHHNTTGDKIFTQSPVFFDPNPVEGTIGSITINENTPVTKFLSGVEYYTIGSTFSVSVSDIDNLNQLSYPLSQLDINGDNFGLSLLTLQGSNLIDWNNSYDNVNASYTLLDWTVDVSDFTFIGDGITSARTKDWINNSWVDSLSTPILVNTETALSTRLIERFQEESWRCPLNGDFDLAGQSSWDSSIDVSLSDAIFYNDGCGRVITDFTTYSPNAINQPNYSTQNETVYLIREFQHDGSASSNIRIYIEGSYTGIWYKIANEYTGENTKGTEWIDALKPFNYGDWNNGSPLNNTGGLITQTSTYLDVTFGTNNVIYALDNKTIYIKISFKNTEKITQLSVVFQ